MSRTEPASRRICVYLAEDDDEMRSLLQLALTTRGFDVVALGSGDALLERLGSDTYGDVPDAIVTDLRMPGRDGLSVLVEVRRRFPAVPVLLITAFGEEAVHIRARQLGAARVLDKPLALDELHTALSEVTSP